MQSRSPGTLLKSFLTENIHIVHMNILVTFVTRLFSLRGELDKTRQIRYGPIQYLAKSKMAAARAEVFNREKVCCNLCVASLSILIPICHLIYSL